MARFLFFRILQSIVVLWAIITVTFFLVRLAPGGPLDKERAVSPHILAKLEEKYGLSDPLMTQYWDNLGPSRQRRPHDFLQV